MFKEMRRSGNQLPQEETIKVLNDGEYGTLSTIGPNGYPYGVPLNYAYHNGSIYFHCATEGHKLENLINNSKVSFAVVIDTDVLPDKFDIKSKSVIVFGEAQEVFGAEKEEGLMALLYKYSSEFIEKGEKYIESAKDKTKVIKIEIEHLTGKER